MFWWDDIEPKINLVYNWNVIIYICTSIWIVNIWCYVCCHPICQYCRYTLVRVIFLELVYLVSIYLHNISWNERWCERRKNLLWNKLCLTRSTKQERLESEIECWSYEIILSAIHLIRVLFADRVRHNHLVVHLYPLIFGVLTGHIYVTVEEYHEIWSNLVNVWWVFCNYRHIICDVNWYRCHQLITSIWSWYLIFDFVVEIV